MYVDPRRRLSLSLLVALLCGLLPNLAVPVRPVQAAAPVVSGIGDTFTPFQTNASTIIMTLVTTAPVAAGNSIVIGVTFSRGDNFRGALSVSCSDPSNGTYSLDGPILNSRNFYFSAACAKHNSAGLASGTAITIQVDNPGQSFGLGAAGAVQISGLAANPLDRTTGAGFDSQNLNSGLTTTTSQPRVLLLGVFAQNSSVANAGLTPGTNGTAIPCATSGTPTATFVTSADRAVTGPLVAMTECAVSTAGAYGASASSAASADGTAQVLAYKAADLPPTLTVTNTALTYPAQTPPAPIDPGLTVTDADSPTLTGATVTIRNNDRSDQDVLAFTNQLGITGNVVGNTVTLSGSATVGDYQTALRTVTYANTSAVPDTTTRTVSFAVSDSAFIPVPVGRQIIISAENTPPSGAGKTITTTEDTPYTFVASDFGYTDPNNTPLLAVKLTTVPVAGTLTDNNTPLTTGQFVPAADITASLLQFTPASDANGTGYASFTFQVQDSGGTASGGSDLDPTPRTMTINVTAVNDPPVNAVPAAQVTAGNTPLVFSTANGNAISVADVDAGSSPLQVSLGVSAGSGTLTLGGTTNLNVTGDGTQTVNLAGLQTDINAGLQGLTFTPTTNLTGPATLTITTDDQGHTGAGGSLQDQDTVQITVGALPTVTVNDPSAVTEGNLGTTSSVTFTVALSTQSNLTIQVPYATANQSATSGASCAPGIDYLTTSGTLTYAPSETSKPISVTICADYVPESTETFLLNLGTPTNATVADGQGIGTITDDDTVGITVGPTSGLVTTEAGGTATFTVHLNSQPTQAVTIALSSSDTTEGTVSPAALTFQPDATALNAQTVTVTGVQDAIADGDVAYTIVTSAASSADPDYNGLAVPDVAVTNLDDETPTRLSISDARVAEGNTGTATLNFTVTLSPPSPDTVSATFATANGTATGGDACTAGVDYVNTSGTLTFQPLETSKPIRVTVCGDIVAERDETVIVNLGAPSGGVALADSQGTGTIVNDDTPGFTVTPTSGLVTSEAGDGAAFSIRLNTQPTSQVAITLSSSDLTEGRVQSVLLLFAPDSTALNPQAVTILGQDDNVIDGDAAYSIVFGAATSADPFYNGLVPPTVAVTNRDDDGIRCSPRPAVTVTTANNNDGRLRVTVSATTAALSATNHLTRIEFDAAPNALVQIPGQAPRSGPFQYDIPNQPTSFVFFVSRTQAGPVTQHFRVVDGCPSQPWPTFVGGGATAF